MKDNQENEFEPEELPEDNAFAYTPRTLDPDECIPEAGSVAQLGPTAGSMLLFEFPLETTENRPLELEIEAENGDNADVRAGHLARPRGAGHSAASSTTRAAGAAVAPPAPARTSITATASSGFAAGA